MPHVDIQEGGGILIEFDMNVMKLVLPHICKFWFSTVGNYDMPDVQTYEVDVTLAALSKYSYNTNHKEYGNHSNRSQNCSHVTKTNRSLLLGLCQLASNA